MAAKITANGIETPLGILTLGQIEKGETILAELYDLFNKKAKRRDEGCSASPASSIPPSRTGSAARRTAVEGAVINTLEAFEQKQQTLQLMKDMLQVNGEGGNVLFDARVDQEYDALGCRIEWIEPDSSEFKEMADHVVRSQVKCKRIKVKNLYRVRRDEEWEQLHRADRQPAAPLPRLADPQLGGHPLARDPPAEDRRQHGGPPHRRRLARPRDLLRRCGLHEPRLHHAGEEEDVA